MDRKHRVFLSYNSWDRKQADQVRAILVQKGAEVFPGAGWPDDVGAALRRADGIVIFATPQYLASPMTAAELQAVLRMPNLANRIVVVGAADESIPWPLLTQQVVSPTNPPAKIAGAILKVLAKAA